jgi:hypothetical protein
MKGLLYTNKAKQNDHMLYLLKKNASGPSEDGNNFSGIILT